MKTWLKFFLAALFCALLLPSLSSAQAIIDNGYNVVFIYKKGDIKLETEAYDTRSVVTPSGNVLKTARFQLPEDHPLIPFWSNKIIQVVLRDENREIICADTHVTVNRKGHFTVVYHINGAGNLLPLGWPLFIK